MVTSISANISSSADSAELTVLQQRLLWLLHDRGAIAAYPMAICALASLEDHQPTPDRPKPLELLREAVTVDRVRGRRGTTGKGQSQEGAIFIRGLQITAETSHVVQNVCYSGCVP